MRIILLLTLLLTYSNAHATVTEMIDTASNFIGMDHEDKKPTTDEIRKKRFDRIWDDVFDELQDGSELVNELDSAPKDAWIRTDKKDIKENINGVIENIISIVIDDDILDYKEKIATYERKILESKEDIASYREAKISAKVDTTFGTTKAAYQAKILAAKQDITNYKDAIEDVKVTVASNFEKAGISLTSEQIDVLLQRVDGDDIIQMALVMDVLNQINEQIVELMKESNEDLEIAKKYYAMHLISLEIAVFIQQKYIDKVTDDFIPGIDKIRKDSNKVIRSTKNSIAREKNKRRRDVYIGNLKAQKFTLKVANLYRKDLINSRKKMRQAQWVVKQDVKLAKNTYATVSLSHDLYKIIADSQNLFNKVSNIQMPHIVPFKNTQIKKEYQKLTSKLNKK